MKRYSTVLASVQATLIACLLLFCQVVSATETVVFYHNDALGSPVAATDENGAVLWREAYSPYGVRLVDEADNNTQWFTGKPEEKQLGLNRGTIGDTREQSGTDHENNRGQTTILISFERKPKTWSVPDSPKTGQRFEHKTKLVD